MFFFLSDHFDVSKIIRILNWNFKVKKNRHENIRINRSALKRPCYDLIKLTAQDIQKISSNK